MKKLNKVIFTIAIIILIMAFFIYNENDSKFNRLIYDKPANSWNEALPIGNGRLGAMIFGGIPEERIQLNEETVWAGGPHNNVNPRASEYFKTVCELLFRKEYLKAQEIANKQIYSIQNGMPYQPVGDLKLEFEGQSFDKVNNYQRQLDISRAIFNVSYEYDGIKFYREIFSSLNENVLVIK